MNRTEEIKKRNNIIYLLFGYILVLTLLIVFREGIYWFKSTQWSAVSTLSWVSISIVLILFSVLQYYFILLLRYSFIKYIVIYIIPIVWLVNNGLAGMHRFMDYTNEVTSSAVWVPIGDLLGWLLGVIYFPLLVGSGVIIAVIDSSGSMLTQACYYIGIAIDVTGISSSSIFSYSVNVLNIILDMLSNTFVQNVMNEIGNNRSIINFNLSNILSLPYWFLNIGYNISCIFV